MHVRNRKCGGAAQYCARSPITGKRQGVPVKRLSWTYCNRQALTKRTQPFFYDEHPKKFPCFLSAEEHSQVTTDRLTQHRFMISILKFQPQQRSLCSCKHV